MPIGKVLLKLTFIITELENRSICIYCEYLIESNFKELQIYNHDINVNYYDKKNHYFKTTASC